MINTSPYRANEGETVALSVPSWFYDYDRNIRRWDGGTGSPNNAAETEDRKHEQRAY